MAITGNVELITAGKAAIVRGRVAGELVVVDYGIDFRRRACPAIAFNRAVPVAFECPCCGAPVGSVDPDEPGVRVVFKKCGDCRGMEL